MTVDVQKKSQLHNTGLTSSLSVFSLLFQGKWHEASYSPRCQPLTRLGGTFTSFTGLPGNEVEASVIPRPAGRRSPPVIQTKCNRQSQDMKGDCCSPTDVTSAGGQANNRTCLWKYQNITCHGVFWLSCKLGTCSVYTNSTSVCISFPSLLSLIWYLWTRQACQMMFIAYAPLLTIQYSRPVSHVSFHN